MAYAPAETAGTVDVTATVAGVTTAPVLRDRFTFLAPTISKIVPTKGPIAGGTQVTITGTNLTGATQVVFGKACHLYDVFADQDRRLCPSGERRHGRRERHHSKRNKRPGHNGRVSFTYH